MTVQAVNGDPGLDLADDLAPTSGHAIRQPLSGWRRVLVGVSVPVVLIVAWCVAAATGVLSQRLLPPPADVLGSARDFVLAPKRPAIPGVVPFAGAAGPHLSASLGRWAVAYAIAVAVGVPLGLGLGLSRWVSAAVDPTFQALRSVPITAWLPIALVWFGIGEGAARFLVFVGAVSPIVIATADTTARVPRQLVDTARMLGTRRRDLARRVYVPFALPGIVTGLRLGLTLGWMSVIVGELTGTTRGLGAMMFSAREVGRLDQIIVGMVAFAVIGLAGDLLLRSVARPFVRWADA
ncbi:MAG: ABC transporter permease [Actinomycetota bacterium]|nr:ABC transporter permease [Actinomycetota bacterium]